MDMVFKDICNKQPNLFLEHPMQPVKGHADTNNEFNNYRPGNRPIR